MMDLEDKVDEILTDLKHEGKKALDKYSKRFDDYEGMYEVTREEKKVTETIPKKDKEKIDAIIERIREIHEPQLEGQDLIFKRDSVYGLIERPIERIGIYVPGGKPLPSTLMMVGVPAKIAGVEEIVVTTPPNEGKVDPYVLYAAEALDIDEIYKIGGVQAIGALTYGIGMKSVDKIFGPGNKYVNEAKRQVYGEVGIDSLAGPSEVAVIADETAKEEQIENDLLAQAEHDEDAKAWLLTTSQKLEKTKLSEDVDVKLLPSLERCVEESNKLAPEHLQIMTENPRGLLDQVKNAGAVYLGEYTPASAADYFLGVNHVLPTGGASRFQSVLTVNDFMKKISVAEAGKNDYLKNKGLGIRMAELEGMEYHKRSMEVRKDEKED